MDRRRPRSPPVYGRHRSTESSSGTTDLSSLANPRSPMPPTGGNISGIKRSQNVAAKAAAERLAHVMATQTVDDHEDDDEDEDLSTGGVGPFRFGAPRQITGSNGGGSGRFSSGLGVGLKMNRSPSPAVLFFFLFFHLSSLLAII